MKTLLLINPVGRKSGYLMSRYSTFAPLGLAYVAAVTPSNWQVRILDENMEPFGFQAADLVAITAFTSNINRAYDIARCYRERGVKVVMGGIHASMNPAEVRRFADAVVIGEVEEIWPAVIADFEAGCLAAVYRGPRVDFNRRSIRPRRDLLHPGYLWQSVQTSRGCPFECRFCSVSNYLGRAYRFRPAADVLDELGRIRQRYIAFVDDNLVGHRREHLMRAKTLFKGMIRQNMNKRWWMQTSINAADDESVVELAAEAGCMFVFIGFETIQPDVLRAMKKGANILAGVEHYKQVVNTFHRYGIGVFGAFIIGNDYENPDYYRQLADFLVRSGIDMFQISVLTPLPGTALMQDMLEADRLIHQNFPADWDKYRFSYMVHRPEGVDIRDVYTGDNYIKHKLYSAPHYPLRLFRSLIRVRRLRMFLAIFKLNQALRKSWRNAHYYRTYPMDFSA